ncbi:MAG: polyribonucleotide nucleotidyltransferase [Dehalococcoidia bacterium]|nr:polyribonucleotide nucleotidyltransferase [Dehalococcoidia bacterium]
MIHKVERELAGRTLTIETGELAQQASGAVTVRYGDNIILATAVMAPTAREGIDFLPLTVDMEERHYAIGKIPGSFFRREGRPGSEAILAGRITDRTIRPLFPKGLRNEVQIILTVLSSDREYPLDTLGVIGASAALTISHVPFEGPVSGCHVGYINGEIVINPTYADGDTSDLDLVVAGSQNAIVMVEAGANEVDESVLRQALQAGQDANRIVIEMQEELQALCGKPKAVLDEPDDNSAVREAIESLVGERLLEAASGLGRHERNETTQALLDETLERLSGEHDAALLSRVFEDVFTDAVRSCILSGTRPDGRTHTQIRPLTSRVGVLPRAHGSALFQRGETQVLNVTTLGPLADAQKIDSLTPVDTKRYLHHYNFPPYSVGEARRVGTPGRREIGHGALAERALLPVIPGEMEFPYTLRLVSDVLGSNGSTSMASVCSSTLSLMDAGVPIKAPVAGIAMGLVTDKTGAYAVLTDIQGLEDHLGDMDFKVAGTAEGVTALQMDIKLTGITDEIMERALAQARDARLELLAHMSETIAETRQEMSPFAPRMTRIQINPERIGQLIGPGGKTIRSIVEETGATVDVENDGTVFVGAADGEIADRAIGMIERLTKDIEVGEQFKGKVVRTTDFGAFVELAPGRDGMVHISELAHYRVGSVEDVIKVGDEVEVLVTDIDPTGRIRLSRRALIDPDAETPPEGAEVNTSRPFDQRDSRGDGGGRRFGDRDRGPRPGGNGRPPRRRPDGDRDRPRRPEGDRPPRRRM